MAKSNRKLKDSEKVAEKMYDVEDYNSQDQTEKGLAITHEQVSDDYMEGTIDGKIDRTNKNDELTSHDGEDIPRKGYE
ncbi:YozQ family protein [Gracilibacillus sp. YIM 98692]|uniref:YozQ family protein n=1 Tax=Gracilibacillus sp. YIM 98692 TaxID=2663532 RepID=UPI0013D32797|nr:YozQ family protein [Gracilibacillus sp. YIM 98692]